MASKDLVLWKDTFGLMTSDTDWLTKVTLLLKECIHHDMSIMTEDMYRAIQQNIYEIYKRNFNFFDDIPSFDEIMNDVESYNHDILKTISDIQYEAEGHLEDPSMPPEDALYEIQRDWEDVNGYNMWENLGDFVYKILVELNLSFYLPDSYISMQMLGDKDLIVLVNDSQSILFPEFIDEQSNNCLAHFYEDTTKLRIIGR